jgi:rhamnosyltransferase
VFISNSPISDEQRDKLNGLYDTLIARENKGFDFGAWKDALFQEGWDKLECYDNVTLMNDTCFGPLFDLGTVYANMEQQKIDFWGLTNYKDVKHNLRGTHTPILEHIQSYCICFNKNIIQSIPFQTFWKNVVYETEAKRVIAKYEIQLTSILARAGYTYTVFIDAARFPNINYDIAIRRPDLCINNNNPFLKMRSFLSFPYQKYIIKLVQEKTDYPVSLIYDHCTEIYEPDISLSIANKLIPARLDNSMLSVSLKIAIHLHIFYLDVFEKYISCFDNYAIDFDLFFTTDTIDKKNYIENYMQSHISGKKLKEVILVQNKGRDILPWLSIMNRLNIYDIAGHFHTKKSTNAEEYIGITWQEEMFDLLVRPVTSIINAFFFNKNIGIIIPEIPYYFHFIYPLHFSNMKQLQISMNNLWKKMRCKKQLDFTKLLTAIMPCGTMFWYRPVALNPLFQLQLTSNDIPSEPISDITILHSIERMLVYITWNEGYDYRIMTPETPQTSNFIDNMVVNKLIRSKEYFLGEFVLVIPRILKKLLKKLLRR